MDRQSFFVYLILFLLIPQIVCADIAYKMRYNAQTGRGDWVVDAESITDTADTLYIRKDGTSTTSAVIPFAFGIQLDESGQDTFFIQKNSGLFKIKNFTYNRDDLTISGAGQWNITAPDGFYVNSPAFFTSSTDFRGTTTVADNILFNIGDGSGQLGNAQFYMDTLNGYVVLDTSNVESLAGGYGLVMQGGSIGINPTGTVFTSFPAVMIGPTVSGVGAAINSMLHVGKQTPSSGATGTIAANVALDYINATNTSSQFNAMNQTFRYNSPNNLTSATVAGASGGRARFITGSSGTGRVTLGAGMSIGITGSTSTATLGTDIFGLLGEANAIAGAQFDRSGHAYFKDYAAPTGSGFVTNLYGLRVEKLSRGTNNYEVALEGAGGVWFRVPTSSTLATERMYSSAASTLDDDANTTRNFRIATATQLALTAGVLTAKDAFDFAVGSSTGTKIATATSQKIAFHNSTPVIQRAGAAQAAVATTASTNITPFGFTTAAQADAIVTLVNEIRAALVEKGLIKGSS